MKMSKRKLTLKQAKEQIRAGLVGAHVAETQFNGNAGFTRGCALAVMGAILRGSNFSVAEELTSFNGEGHETFIFALRDDRTSEILSTMAFTPGEKTKTEVAA